MCLLHSPFPRLPFRSIFFNSRIKPNNNSMLLELNDARPYIFKLLTLRPGCLYALPLLFQRGGRRQTTHATYRFESNPILRAESEPLVHAVVYLRARGSLGSSHSHANTNRQTGAPIFRSKKKKRALSRLDTVMCTRLRVLPVPCTNDAVDDRERAGQACCLLDACYLDGFCISGEFRGRETNFLTACRG